MIKNRKQFKKLKTGQNEPTFYSQISKKPPKYRKNNNNELAQIMDLIN